MKTSIKKGNFNNGGGVQPPLVTPAIYPDTAKLWEIELTPTRDWKPPINKYSNAELKWITQTIKDLPKGSEVMYFGTSKKLYGKAFKKTRCGSNKMFGILDGKEYGLFYENLTCKLIEDARYTTTKLLTGNDYKRLV
jgi:hypothetical protein